MGKCCVNGCECGIDKSMPKFNRGGRVIGMCENHFKEMLAGLIENGERLQTLPKLKDIKTTYSFGVMGLTETVGTELLGAKFKGNGKGDFGKYARFTSPEYTRLNSPIRYQQSLKLMTERYGAKFIGLRVKMYSPSREITKVYRAKTVDTDWQNFIRECEQDFCDICGFKTSAKKTGTRK